MLIPYGWDGVLNMSHSWCNKLHTCARCVLAKGGIVNNSERTNWYSWGYAPCKWTTPKARCSNDRQAAHLWVTAELLGAGFERLQESDGQHPPRKISSGSSVARAIASCRWLRFLASGFMLCFRAAAPSCRLTYLLYACSYLICTYAIHPLWTLNLLAYVFGLLTYGAL